MSREVPLRSQPESTQPDLFVLPPLAETTPEGNSEQDFTASFDARRQAAQNRVETLSPREKAKERGRAFFGRIGRSAVARGIKNGLKAAFVDTPATAVGYTIMGAEGYVRGVKSDARAIKDAGDALDSAALGVVQTVGEGFASDARAIKGAGDALDAAALGTVQAATEGLKRGVERGKDGIANTRERVKIGLGKFSLSNIGVELAFREDELDKAIRARMEAEAKEREARGRVREVLKVRSDRIDNIDAARDRIANRRAKWDGSHNTKDVAEAA